MVIESRRLKWAGQVVRMEEVGTFNILTGKTTGKILLGRHRCRRE